MEQNPGLKMVLIGPHLIFNQDDFGQFLVRKASSKASNGNKAELLLTHVLSLDDKGTRSCHTAPEHKFAPRGGIRVKRSVVVLAVALNVPCFHWPV